MCPIARRNSLSSFKKSHPRHSASSSTKAPTTSSVSVDFWFWCSLFLHDPDQGLTKGALFSHVNWTESFWGTNHQPSSRCLSNTRNANEAGGHARRWVEHNTLTRAILMIYPLFLVERGLEPKDDQTEDTHTKASETTTSDEDYTRKLLISRFAHTPRSTVDYIKIPFAYIDIYLSFYLQHTRTLSWSKARPSPKSQPLRFRRQSLLALYSVSTRNRDFFFG